MEKLLHAMASIGAVIAGYAVALLGVLITFEVVARKLLRFSLQGVDEIGGYVVVVAAGFGYVYAALRGEHTRITVFTARLPASMQRALDVGALALFALFSGFLSYAMVRLMSRSLAHHTISLGALATPLWIPQLVLLVSLVFLTVVAVVLTVRCATDLQREGDTQ